jgi:hypothetical protein
LTKSTTITISTKTQVAFLQQLQKKWGCSALFSLKFERLRPNQKVKDLVSCPLRKQYEPNFDSLFERRSGPFVGVRVRPLGGGQVCRKSQYVGPIG